MIISDLNHVEVVSEETETRIEPRARQLLHPHSPAQLPRLALVALPSLRVRLLFLTGSSNSSVDHPSETQLCKEMQ
jgi:hypothetical protein